MVIETHSKLKINFKSLIFFATYAKLISGKKFSNSQLEIKKIKTRNYLKAISVTHTRTPQHPLHSEFDGGK